MKKLRLWTVTLLLVSFLFLPMGIASDVPFADVPFDINNIPEPGPPPKEVRDFFDLDPFYQQWINIESFPVLASEKVSPYALKEAAWLIWQMIGHRRDLINVFVRNKVHFVVMAYNEVLSDIPEFSPNHVDFLVYNTRGEGGTAVVGHPTPTTGEENVLGDISTYRAYSVLIHELAHVVHLFGLTIVDPTFDNRLQSAYDTAMVNGLWQGTYAASNSWEYWAEGTHAWFYPRGGGSFTGDTRQALKKYDPPLASLLTEIYGDSNWRYTPLRERTHLPHLQGFNPQDAPTFQPSQELVETYEKFLNPNSDGGDKWVDLRAYDPSLLHSLNEPRITGSHTTIAFINLTQADILLYGVARDGTARFWKRLPPHQLQWAPTRPGAIYLIKDANGRDIALFQTVKKTGRALITPTLNLITSGLSKVSGDNQSGISGTVLSNPFVIEVRDETLSALEGISVTFTVTVGDGTLSITHTTTDENGRAQSTLTLGPNLGTNTIEVSAVGIAQPVIFNAVAEPAVDIPDLNLRAAVKTTLGKAEGDPITPSEMAILARLEARDANIRNLTGLEHATNLKDLRLDRNAISDISVLAGLTALTGLGLDENSISDISALAGLTNLTNLLIGGNNISDISVLAGLTNLRGLSLYNNNISDISAVTKLTDLTRLWLDGNNISDISPLVANTGLGVGGEVYLRRWNPLSYHSIHTHIPALRSRGVTVEFDNRPHPALLKISGDNQKGAAFAQLSQPFVVEAQDENGSALAGISVTFAVTTGGGTLSTTITRTDTNGRAQSTLTLGPNLGTNTVQVSAAGIAVPATFHAVSDTEAPPITADVNSDGSVNVLDLILIASELGNAGTNLVVDVNGDGVVSILDLILVAGMFEGAAAAPSAQPQVPETLTAVEVEGWLTDARALQVKDPIMKRGFLVLEQLLAALTPRETELLSNYPNPFNPETWIPYRLSEDAFVTLTIYDSSGQVVRSLDVGHRIAAAYENRSKAIHWDGRNDLGEQVASGIYFYTLTAGDFSATRRMVILK